jgi:hypothetical protein
MASAIGKRFSLLRFSLRSLFVLVTAICVLFGYELNWVHQRRTFIREQVIKDEGLWAFSSIAFYRSDDRREHPKEWHYYSNKPAPYLLWLFGETALPVLYLLVPESDATVNRDHLIDRKRVPCFISRNLDAYRRATRLFPESQIHVYVMGAGHAQAINEDDYKIEVEKTRMHWQKMKLKKSGEQSVIELAE